MNHNLYLSKRMKEIIGKLPDRKTISVGGLTFPIYESSLFPFEIHYDACDVESQQEVKIPSGIMVHGAVIPQQTIEFQPPSFEFSFDTMRKNFFTAQWGLEIFK